MHQYTILQQYKPPLYAIPPFCQPGFFFNDGEHLQQQRNGAFHLLSALNTATQQIEARCAFFVENGKAVSPGAAPFGSIEFSESLADTVLDSLLDSLTMAVRSSGSSTLRLVNYPDCYAPDQASRLAIKLVQNGFRLIKSDQNFFLPVDKAVFVGNLDPAERRRLIKCRKANFQFSHWPSPDVNMVIDFLRDTRQQQGYSLTVEPDILASLLVSFPNQFSVFVVKDGSNLAALTITVRVRPDILYNFLPASPPAYSTFSPMVMLTDGLFSYCQQHHIRLLDLGVSLDSHRQPKPGLIRFKQNLGAQSSPKRVFEKTL